MICLKSNQKGCIVITFFRAFHYICIIQDAFGKVFQTSLKLYAHLCVYL